MVLTDSTRLTWKHSQTFGGLVNFNPHVHVLAADGVFGTDGVFVELARMRIYASEDSLIVSLRAGLLDDPGPHPGVGGDPLGELLRPRGDDVHALGKALGGLLRP